MAQSKKKIETACAVSVKGLSDEDVRMVKEFADFLRQKGRRDKRAVTKENISFGSWPLGVKDDLGRREIYDHL